MTQVAFPGALMRALILTLAILGGMATHGVANGQEPPATPTAAHTGTGAVYLTIRNEGDAPEVLLGATTGAARTVEIHDTELKDGVMSMTPLPDGLEIPANGSVSLAPGGYHLMLIDLQLDLVEGSTFDVTLIFATAGEITITVAIQANAPASEAEERIGTLVVSGAWSRPAPRLDDCGCSIPDAARDFVPAATPAS